MAFQFETDHEIHTVDVAPNGDEFIAYIATNYKGGGHSLDILQLGAFETEAEAQSAVSVAMLAMQRVTR